MKKKASAPGLHHKTDKRIRTTEQRQETTVLVCPLDWGIGHASRLIPVINRFKDNGYTVMIGGSGKSGELLQNTFSGLQYIHIPSNTIRYSIRSALIFSLIVQLPAILYNIRREHLCLKKILKFNKIDVVVSDNRYGLFSPTTRNIFITHQVSPILPGVLSIFRYPLYLMLKLAISRFDECWIPDYGGPENLTGQLSHQYTLPRNARFIGILSRFSDNLPDVYNKEKHDLVIVLSGPQPRLGNLTRLIIEQALKVDFKTLIICGLQKGLLYGSERPGLTVVDHLEPGRFRNVIENAGIVICTSGYSTIMDLVALRKPAILVPTPGQPEQEYLSSYLAEKKMFVRINQSDLDLKKIQDYNMKLSSCKIPSLFVTNRNK